MNEHIGIITEGGKAGKKFLLLGDKSEIGIHIMADILEVQNIHGL